MEDKKLFHSIMKTICGKKYILMMTDTAEILSRTQQLQKNASYKMIYDKVSQSIKNHIISGGALGVGLSLSLQRYFPSHFSTLSLNKILLDMMIFAVCLFTATNMALKTNYNQLGVIKKDLMLSFDNTFLKHMAQIQIKYEIDEQDQVRGLFTQQEYQQWLSKRHNHIY